MNIFYFRKRFLILLACLTGGLLIGQLFYKKDEGDPLSRTFYFIFGEIQAGAAGLRGEMSNVVKKYLFLLNLRDENRQLRRENRELTARHKIFEEIQRENRRLRKLADFPKSQSIQLLPAQVIGTDFLSKNELLIINKGKRHGVKKFMGVLHPQGVVGWVFRTTPNSSQVISLLNPLSSLPARHQKGRIAGLIVPHKGKPNLLSFDYMDEIGFEGLGNDKGNGKNHKAEEDVREGEEFRPGDKIVTVGTDQFPGGFPVGLIEELDFSKKFRPPKIYVRPSVNFYSLEEVMLVLSLQAPLDKDKTPLDEDKTPLDEDKG